jgi:hypothetical protein
VSTFTEYFDMATAYRRLARTLVPPGDPAREALFEMAQGLESQARQMMRGDVGPEPRCVH